MILRLKNIFSTCIDWIFPPRHDERMIAQFTEKEIFSLPKAYDNLPDHTHALFSYKDKRVTALVWEIKYHKNNKALSLVLPLLADLIQDEYAERALFNSWNHCILVPIPSTDAHVQKRGYAHTQYICEKLISLLPRSITYAPSALIKTKHTRAQHKLKDRKARLTNLNGVFSVNHTLPPHTAIILIDDVTTTGATLTEARRALTEAGAKDILAFTIAH